MKTGNILIIPKSLILKFSLKNILIVNSMQVLNIYYILTSRNSKMCKNKLSQNETK